MAKLSRFGPYKYYVPHGHAHYIFSTAKNLTFSEKVVRFYFFLHQNDRSVKGYQPMGCATSASEKRRQFMKFSKCYNFNNFNAKITSGTRGINVGCLRLQNWPISYYDLCWPLNYHILTFAFLHIKLKLETPTIQKWWGSQVFDLIITSNDL